MKRLLSLLLVAVLFVSCSTPVAEETATSPEAVTPVETPQVTPVTPIDEHDHEHVGEILSTEVYQAILEAATELELNIKYVDQASGVAYGTELEDEDITISALDGGVKEELYRVDKSREWVDLKGKIGDQLIVVEKNPQTQDGRVFLLDVNTKETTDIVGDKIYHGPVTSNFVVRENKVYFAYDEKNEDIGLVSFDVTTGELVMEVEHAFDPKEHQGDLYYLKMVNYEVGLYKLSADGETETVVDPGLNIYDYYLLGDRLDLLLYVVSSGDQFNYLRIKDFIGGGSMNDYPFVKPIVWGEDILIANSEHQTIVEDGAHIHAFPENSQVGQDTYFTYATGDKLYFTTTSDDGNRYYSISQTDLLREIEDEH